MNFWFANFEPNWSWRKVRLVSILLLYEDEAGCSLFIDWRVTLFAEAQNQLKFCARTDRVSDLSKCKRDKRDWPSKCLLLDVCAFSQSSLQLNGRSHNAILASHIQYALTLRTTRTPLYSACLYLSLRANVSLRANSIILTNRPD